MTLRSVKDHGSQRQKGRIWCVACCRMNCSKDGSRNIHRCRLAEGRSPRLVVDSSISGVTAACGVPSRMLLPRIADVAACAPEVPTSEPWLAVSLDIRKAHRQLKVLPLGQAWLSFSFEGRFFVSKTLNFGARASALWWGRMAGALARITRALIWLPDLLWDYVDDFLGGFRSSAAPLQAGLWVILFLALRVESARLGFHGSLDRLGYFF